MWRNWQAARTALTQYLSVQRQTPALSRARFYVGQCYNFLGDTRSALTEFLGLQQQFPDEIETWTQACLGRMSDR
jgi:TolA-binding protein